MSLNPVAQLVIDTMKQADNKPVEITKTRYRIVITHERGDVTKSTIIQNEMSFTDISRSFASAIKDGQPFSIRTSPFDSYAIFPSEYICRCKIELIREMD